jgi:hypothetical protein
VRAETKLHFELICSVWREHPFATRRELHDALAARMGNGSDDETILGWAHEGIDLALDCFAKSGPDENTFAELIERS